MVEGQEFTAIDQKGRTVQGVVLDVLPWSRWPIKCDVRVNGVRQITQYNVAELDFVSPTQEVAQ